MKFLPYEPDQAWLLPPSVKDVLGNDHLCFFVHKVVERLDLSRFEEGYGEEGRRAYAPALMIKVWLYAYALQVTSSRGCSSGCEKTWHFATWQAEPSLTIGR
jgi:transposase